MAHIFEFTEHIFKFTSRSFKFTFKFLLLFLPPVFFGKTTEFGDG